MQLFWTYTPSPVDRNAAEMWINTHDCSVVDMIAIGEHSLATTATRIEGARPPAVTIKRHCDLCDDLSTAVVNLRLRMPPPFDPYHWSGPSAAMDQAPARS